VEELVPAEVKAPAPPKLEFPPVLAALPPVAEGGAPPGFWLEEPPPALGAPPVVDEVPPVAALLPPVADGGLPPVALATPPVLLSLAPEASPLLPPQATASPAARAHHPSASRFIPTVVVATGSTRPRIGQLLGKNKARSFSRFRQIRERVCGGLRSAARLCHPGAGTGERHGGKVVQPVLSK
jgi:hypothetical protein